MRDLKYLAAFTIPIVALVSINLRGGWSFASLIFAFVLIPILELIFPVNAENLDKNDVEIKQKNRFFDWLLYHHMWLVQ